MPKEYEVSLPLAGIIRMTVLAENEHEATDIALNASWHLTSTRIEFYESQPDITALIDVSLDELEVHEHITRGNVCYAPLNDIEVDCISEDEDDED